LRAAHRKAEAGEFFCYHVHGRHQIGDITMITEAEVRDFFRQIGLTQGEPTQFPVVERPQFVSAEDPRILYVVRLSGDTRSADSRGRDNA
jgi:hypothetical protein